MIRIQRIVHGNNRTVIKLWSKSGIKENIMSLIVTFKTLFPLLVSLLRVKTLKYLNKCFLLPYDREKTQAGSIP